MVAGRTHIPVVDRQRCGSCGACIKACPAWVLPSLRREEGSLRGAVARGTSFPSLPAGAKWFDVPPCVAACPLGQDVPAYLSAIRRGEIDLAVEIILATNPLPSVLGRVCARPCVRACIRGSADIQVEWGHKGGSVPDIRGLKHYAVSAGTPQAKGPGGDGWIEKRKWKEGGPRVLIIGAGPAGLAAASVLLQAGVKVVIYEKENEPGGMLRYGLGEFDLPLVDLRRDVDRIVAEGAEIKTGEKVESPDDFERAVKRTEAAAVLVAVGAHLPGSHFRRNFKYSLSFRDFSSSGGGLDAVSFMWGVRSQVAGLVGPMDWLKGIVVEGYGPWAATVARAAARLGAEKVTLLVPLPPGRIDWEGWKLDKAIAEGVVVVPSVKVDRVSQSSGGTVEVEYVEVVFSGKEERSRPFAVSFAGRFRLVAAGYISAMEREPDCEWIFGGGVLRGVGGTIVVNSATAMTGRRGLFAAGDVVTGPRSVISAVAMGVRAAYGIIEYLGN